MTAQATTQALGVRDVTASGWLTRRIAPRAHLDTAGKALLRQVLYGGAGAAVVLGLSLGLEQTVVPAAVAGVAMTLGLNLIFEPFADYPVAPGVTRLQVQEAMDTCRAAAVRVEGVRVRIAPHRPEMTETLLNIALRLDGLAADLAQDPSDVRKVYGFVRHILPELLTLLDGYAVLSEKAGDPAAIGRAEERIIDFDAALDLQLAALLSNDAQRLDLADRNLKALMDSEYGRDRPSPTPQTERTTHGE